MKASELDIRPGYEGLPMVLIADGRVQPNNLSQTGLDAAWLDGVLKGRGLAPEGVYLASLDTQGRMTLQMKGGGLMRFEALAPGEVKW